MFDELTPGGPFGPGWAFLESADESELCSWLLRGFKEANFDPVTVVYDLDYLTVRDQLKGYFDAARVGIQEKLKRAVVRAIVEWRLKGHGLALLRELTYLAADFRASDVVPVLRTLVASGRIPDVHSGEGSETLVAVVSVLGGFAGHPEAKRFLKRLLFDPSTPERPAAIILNSLCEYAPTEYPEYLPVFMRILEQGRESFHTNLVFRHFARVVGFDFIADGLEQLDASVRSAFLQQICSIFADTRSRLDPTTEQVIATYIQADLRGRTADMTGTMQGDDFVVAPLPRQTVKSLLRNTLQSMRRSQDIINFVLPPTASGVAA